MSSFKCTRCNKVHIDEEYDGHECVPMATDYEEIKVAYFFETTDKLKRKIIRAMTLEGKILNLIEIPENKASTKIPYQTPNLNTEKINSTNPKDLPDLEFQFCVELGVY